jgi:methionyl-tRNA formyltransferase
MKLLFAGSPELALPSLEKVAQAGGLCAVLTGADQPTGRGRRVEPTPVKARAVELGIPVIEADKVDQGIEDRVRSLAPDLLVVVAFGRIFRTSFLALFPRGGINLHPSLLPRHRGPSPLTAAILAGDAETGVTIQKIALKFDSGDVLAQERVTLAGTETTASLSESLAPLGAELLAGVLSRLRDGDVSGQPQDESKATYCRLVRKEDGRIDWSAPAAAVDRLVRAYDPWPRASTLFCGQSLLVLKSSVLADTLGPIAGPGSDSPPGTVLGTHPRHGILVRAGDGILAVERLQLQFKKALDWRSFLNGHADVIGTRLGG